MMGICHVNEHLLLPHYFVFSQWTCRNFSKKNLFHCAYTQQQQSLIKNLMFKKFNLGYSRIASSFTSTTALTRRRSLTLSRSVEGLKMILLLVFCAMRVYSIQNTQSFKIPFITSFKITMKCNTLRAYAIHTYSHNPFPLWWRSNNNDAVLLQKNVLSTPLFLACIYYYTIISILYRICYVAPQ